MVRRQNKIAKRNTRRSTRVRMSTKSCPVCKSPMGRGDRTVERFGTRFCSNSCAYEAYPVGTKDPRKKKTKPRPQGKPSQRK